MPRASTTNKTRMSSLNQYVGQTVKLNAKGNKAWMQKAHPDYVKRKSEGTLGPVRKYRPKKSH